MGKNNPKGGASGSGDNNQKEGSSKVVSAGTPKDAEGRVGNGGGGFSRGERDGGEGGHQNVSNSKGFNNSNQQGAGGPRQNNQRQKPFDSQQTQHHHEGGRSQGYRQNSRRSGGDEYKKHVEKQWHSDPRENFARKEQRGPRRQQGAPVSLNSSPGPGVVKHLQQSLQENRILEKPSLQDVINKSIDFWENFPSDTARLHMLQKGGVPDSKLEAFVHSVYPIVHHSCLNLMNDFLEFKRAKGSSIERSLYSNMNLISFMDRLLKQRPLAFLGSNDRYLLPNLRSGSEGFEAIGTDREQPPLLLENFLSYDEMRISALVSLSSWSVFVNDGRRKNYGKPDQPGTFQEDGVIVGQVGARLKREGVMDYLDCVVTRSENITDKGFGGNNQWHVNSVFDKLWGKALPTYEEANRVFNAFRDGKPQPEEFEIIPIGTDLLFNVTVYKKRILIPAEILLCEANTRAREAGKKAYVHVVGLGLGVWRASNKQEEMFVEAWGDALHNIKNTDHIAHVDFSYIDSYAVHGVKDGDTFPGTNITIHFSNRNLHDKVPEDCILVCSYAWDGNSLPGNEFWMGKMCSTGDSAAACSSCVAEIHNHLFNPLVSGDTLRVATQDGYLMTWQEYLCYFTGNDPKQRAATRASKHPPVMAPSSGPAITPRPASVQPSPKPDLFDNPGSLVNTGPTPSFQEFPSSNASLSVNGISAPLTSPQRQVAPVAEPMESDVNTSWVELQTRGGRASVSDSLVVETSLSTSVESDTQIRSPPTPVSKKPRQSDDADVVEVVEEKKQDVPKQIPHATIVGLMIDNPAYKPAKKQGTSKKSKDKVSGENSRDSNSCGGGKGTKGAGKSNQSQSSGGGKGSKGAGKSNPSQNNNNSSGGGGAAAGGGGGGKGSAKKVASGGGNQTQNSKGNKSDEWKQVNSKNSDKKKNKK